MAELRDGKCCHLLLETARVQLKLDRFYAQTDSDN